MVDCRRFLAAISAHSTSKGSEGPPLEAWLIAADPSECALAWRGGARRGLTDTCGTGDGTEPVILPNHCSGFGKPAGVESGCTCWTEKLVRNHSRLASLKSHRSRESR